MARVTDYAGTRRRRWIVDYVLVPLIAFSLTAVLGTGLIKLSGVDFAPEPLRGQAVSAHFVKCVQGRPANCVVDGDTLRHEGVVIRIADIDTPEISQPQCADEAALGARATQRLMTLVNAGPFEIARSGNRDEDVYGRKLRILVRDGQSLGGILVAEGLAHVWDGSKHPWC